MQPTQLRLDPHLKKAVEALAKRDGTSASDAMRKLLQEGLRTVLLRQAVEGYLEKRLSLGGAAEHAGISIGEMAAHLAALDIPVYRYSPAELDRDIERARSWLK
jgi:predicted HTH domain antitoxin